MTKSTDPPRCADWPDEEFVRASLTGHVLCSPRRFSMGKYPTSGGSKKSGTTKKR